MTEHTALPQTQDDATPQPQQSGLRVAVLGEIPFAGSRVVRALVKQGLAVRVLCPDAEAEQTVLSAGRAAGVSPASGAAAAEGTAASSGVGPQSADSGCASVEVTRGSLDLPPAVLEVLQGADGACFVSPITMAGRMYRSSQHLADVQLFLETVLTTGVRNVVYHSALGAHPKAASRALRDAAAAEEAVKAAATSSKKADSSLLFKYYLARSSTLMGLSDCFLTEILRTAKASSPFVGVSGYGSTLVQPLHVDNFAQCLARFFSDRPEELETGRYALAGPETATLLGLLDQTLARLGRPKLKLHAPFFVLRLLSAFSPNEAPGTSDKSQSSGRGGIASASASPGLKERTDLLLDEFCTDHNDAPRLLGPGETLCTLEETQKQILAAATC
ncbi:MAG: hypothetical protein ABSE73_23160 [Planctomycetota bacterium]